MKIIKTVNFNGKTSRGLQTNADFKKCSPRCLSNYFYLLFLYIHIQTPLSKTVAPHTVSGIPYNLRIDFVIIPNVPSEPTKRLVMLYPAEVFLQKNDTGLQYLD